VIPKLFAIFIAAVLYLLAGVTPCLSQNFACQYAAQRHFKAVGMMCDIMVPLWVHAYPDKDYHSIMAASPDIQLASDSIVTTKISSRNHEKMELYKSRKEEFLKQSLLFVDAVNKYDSGKAYEIFPQLWESLETLSSTLLPIPYPTFDDFHSAVIRFVHVDKQVTRKKIKMTAVSATALLAEKLQLLTAENVPKNATGKPELAVEEFAYFAKLVAKLQEMIRLKDAAQAWEVANELDVRLNTFEHYYLE